MTAWLRKLLATAMVVVQWVLMGMHLVLRIPSFVIHAVPKLWLRHVYYRWTVLRRRVAGEPRWKEIDVLIGVYPPDGHPWWEAQRSAELSDMNPFLAGIAGASAIVREVERSPTSPVVMPLPADPDPPEAA